MTRCTLYTWVQNPGTDHCGVTNKCEKYTGYTVFPIMSIISCRHAASNIETYQS